MCLAIVKDQSSKYSYIGDHGTTNEPRIGTPALLRDFAKEAGITHFQIFIAEGRHEGRLVFDSDTDTVVNYNPGLP